MLITVKKLKYIIVISTDQKNCYDFDQNINLETDQFNDHEIENDLKMCLKMFHKMRFLLKWLVRLKTIRDVQCVWNKLKKRKNS